MKYFEYKNCGCQFPLNKDGNIIFDPDITKINLECKSTWDLISSGNTKGCFQLESRLGRSMAKKLKPESIEQLSALISIMRPGCLEAVRDGKTVSSHFIDKKNGLESVDYFHPALEPILSNTFGEMVYQEQAMQIAKELAGFDLQEADMLRKAIGKKKASEMANLKEKFIDGCLKLKIISKDQADQIFSWIEKSQRYSFNKCLDLSTVVETPEGLKTIDEIKAGDRVLGPTSNGDEFIEVLDVIDTGEKEVVEIELDNGQTITSTLDHKFLCHDGEKHPLWEIIALKLEIMVYE